MDFAPSGAAGAEEEGLERRLLPNEDVTLPSVVGGVFTAAARGIHSVKPSAGREISLAANGPEAGPREFVTVSEAGRRLGSQRVKAFPGRESGW